MSDCRGDNEIPDEVPCIVVRCVGERALAEVSPIEHGLEEEGVPWAVQQGYPDDAVTVAYEAAVHSSLKIGVSVTPQSRIVVHHKQLPANDPVFDLSGITMEAARRLGSNAARLAKGTPLKPIT